MEISVRPRRKFNKIFKNRESIVQLTPIEFELLSHLAKNAGKVQTRVQLLEATAERRGNAFERSIDVHISLLRHKLGDHPRHPQKILTIRSAGYMLKRQ